MPGMDLKETLSKAYTYEGTIAIYRAVKTGSVTGAVVQVTGATDTVKGFAHEAGVAGENHAIHEAGGHILVEAGASFSADTLVTIDSVGRVVAAAPATGANVQVVGKVLEAAGAAGDIVPMLFQPFTMQGA